MVTSSDARTVISDQYPIMKNEVHSQKTPMAVTEELDGSFKRLMGRPSVVVAIPAYNEEVAIGSVVARCKKHADCVIVIDDGSKDHTAEVAGLVGAEVITHELNSGYGAAIRTCFEAAKERDADIMIIIDADGQHNPDDIPALVDDMKQSGSDIVIGSRFVNGNDKNQKIPAYRKVGMKVLDTATNMGSGYRVTDSQSGFRAYSRNAIAAINLGNNGMAAGSEILMQAAENKLKISEVPIKVRYDLENTSSENPVKHGLGVLGSIIRLISQRRPLLFFCVPGALLLLIGIASGVIVLDNFNSTRYISVFYTLWSFICIILGTFSVFTGLILQSILNLKLQLK